jgi:LPXTG-motif cell wall-anchored protein
MVRTNEGGSVLSFVVVGVVILLMLVGGIFAVRQLTSQPAPLTQEPAKTTPEQAKPQEQKPQESTKPSSSEKEQAATPQTQTPAASNPELPKTGPTETVGFTLVLALITLAGVSYFRSRQALRSSL